jgi:hypothetical protein
VTREQGLPESLKELDDLNDDEVIARYDYWANASGSYEREGLRFWRTECEYRRQRMVANTMKRLTWVMTGLTALVAFFTIALYIIALR